VNDLNGLHKKVDHSLPMDVNTLIPHERPMRLIDRLLKAEEQSGIAEAIVQPESPLLDEDGCLEPVVMIELIAQTYAAMKGYQDLSSGRSSRKGFLVGISDFHVVGRTRAGQRLRIKVETVGSTGGFALAEGEVYQEGERVAAGAIKVWVPE
jgi:predicted hotdog family 3-hydroxylacyl-ACP dehydratase